MKTKTPIEPPTASLPAIPHPKAIPVLGRSEGLEGLLRTQSFQLLLKSGAPVEVDDLAKLSQTDRSKVAATLGDLDRAGRIRRDEAGRVVGAAGLSVVPASHQIEVGGRHFWTWCAYDALGILGSLGKGGTVITKSPQTGDRLEIQFDGPMPLRHDLVLLMADTSDCVSTVEDYCPRVNLFESEELARQWMAGNGVEGEVLTIDEATRVGIADWTPLLDTHG